MHFNIEIEGGGPGFIMNSPSSLVPEAEKKNAKGAASRAEQRLTGKDEAESLGYRLPESKRFPNGEFYIPSEWIMGAVLQVCNVVQLDKEVGGTGKKSGPKSWIAGGMWIEPGKIPLGIQDAEVLTMMVRVPPRTGGMVPRSRYRISKWRAAFRLHVSDVDIGFANVAIALDCGGGMRDILVLAGTKAGIGSNRPGSGMKPGPHGTFRVLKCVLVK